jgi:hypothetical protein
VGFGEGADYSVQICCSDGTVSTKVGVGHYEQVMYLCEIIH